MMMPSGTRARGLSTVTPAARGGRSPAICAATRVRGSVRAAAAAAERTLARDADNDRRIARYKLDQALRERGLGESYAAAICRTQYRCSLAEASPRQLWRLVYTIRNRRRPARPAAQPAGEVPF